MDSAMPGVMPRLAQASKSALRCRAISSGVLVGTASRSMASRALFAPRRLAS